jgi:hypothetical protein
VVGRATPVLSRRRTIALVALTIALVAYGAVAGKLWDLPTGAEVAVLSLVVFPTFAAAIWLALPLAHGSSGRLLAEAAIAAGFALGLAWVDLGSASNVAKLACFALLGFWFLSLFEELWWVAAVALTIPWVDIWSVAAGPTRYVVEQKPGIFEHLSVAFPNVGEMTSVNVGPPDIIFFALFLAASARFRLRVGWTWAGMTGCLSLTLALVWQFDISGLPALPAVSLGFLLPNADLVWRSARDARNAARRRGGASSSG